MDEQFDELLTQLISDQTVEEEDKVSKESYSKYREEREKTEISKLKEEIANIKQDRLQRKWLAERIFDFSSLYMFAVFFIIFMVASPNQFKLSDDVLNMLLGTTTANVLGILVIVATYFFAKNKIK